MGGIFECIMLMNDEPHVILALLVGLKKSLVAQRLIMLEQLTRFWKWILEASRPYY
jgi:hypothetical protein